MSVWDDPELRNNEFVKFDKVGDRVSGTVQRVKIHHFDDGSAAPQIFLVTDDGEEKVLTGGAVRLKVKLAEDRPEPGDHIVVELESEEPRGGGKTLRHWKVDVTRGTGAPAAPAATPAEPAVNPQAAAAALANLTPEQKKALGIAA